MSSDTEIDQALDAFESAASATGFLIEPEAAWPQTNPRRRKPKGVDEEFLMQSLSGADSKRRVSISAFCSAGAGLDFENLMTISRHCMSIIAL